MKKSLVHPLFCLVVLHASVSMQAESPVLRHVFDIHASCGEPLTVGRIQGGKRVVIPITGGSVEGDINGRILPGGADYQLIDTIGGRTEFRAVYTVVTSDSLYVNVCNTGVALSSGPEGGYFTTAPVFEAPADSPAAWLNNRIFVCRPTGFGDGMVHLRVWAVE